MDKVLLILGASSDMGCALMERVAEGYDFIIGHYNHMNDKLQNCQRALGEKLILIKANLGGAEQVQHFIEEVRQKNILPTHIIHFAAPQCENKQFHKIEWDVFQRELDVSLKSVILVLQAFLPHMARLRRGRVILMLSFVVNNAPPKYCANYVVAKYALLGLVKALASEYAEKHITVNGVSPAWVHTKYIDNQPDLLIEKNAAESPLGRILDVSEVLPTIEYLLSDGAECVSGQNIVISCGR